MFSDSFVFLSLFHFSFLDRKEAILAAIFTQM